MPLNRALHSRYGQISTSISFDCFDSKNMSEYIVISRIMDTKLHFKKYFFGHKKKPIPLHTVSCIITVSFICEQKTDDEY
jgi:hypothetical protein